MRSLRGLFVWPERRPPQIAERGAPAALDGAAPGAIYLLIFAPMWRKDEPGDMGQLLFFFHYLCYPTALALVLHLGRRGG